MPLSVATDQPFSGLGRQARSANDRLHAQYFGFCPNETWMPNVNLYETETGYLICVDLAGVDKDKIDVVAEDRALRIRGQRLAPCPPDCTEGELRKLRLHLMEIDYGAFSRVVELPEDVDHTKIEAVHRNGLLWIELPKMK